jgi:protein gp37
MKTTKIEWTERVWNPTKGCTKISDGCKFCYAELFARRLQAIGIDDYKDGFKFKILPERLNDPIKVIKPTKFFVNSMSDLFHEKMPFNYLDMIFQVIKKTPQHIYQILTKREKIMFKYFSKREVPKNVWIGVTVENERFKDRINFLRKIKAKVKFISFEPLIGSVGKLNLFGIDWVIVGGESGNNARPIKKEWVEEIFNQCKKENVPFFFKQWGTWGSDNVKRNKKANGRIFKGKEWNEYPKSNLELVKY